MLCCGYILTDLPISIRLISLALWQSNDCPSASKATLVNVGKCIMWIHYEWLHNHNKAKHNKTVCKFLGIYCSQQGYCRSASKPGYQTNAQAHKSTIKWTIRHAVWLRRRPLSINQQYIMNPGGYNQTVLVIKVDLLWLIASMPQPKFVPTLLIFVAYISWCVL